MDTEAQSNAFALTELLVGRHSPLRSSIRKFYADVSGAFGTALARLMKEAEANGESVACRGKGCSWCCYDVALVTPIELFVLVDALDQKPYAERIQIKRAVARWERVHIKDDATVPTTVRPEQFDQKYVESRVERTIKSSMRNGTPCPFLIDGACSVYESRPIACKGHHSFEESPESCRRKNLGEVAIKCLNMLPLTGAFAQIIQEHGFPFFPAGELTSMLIAVLERRRDPEFLQARTEAS